MRTFIALSIFVVFEHFGIIHNGIFGFFVGFLMGMALVAVIVQDINELKDFLL